MSANFWFFESGYYSDIRLFLCESSAIILNRCAEPGFKLYTSAISFANITYFVSKFRTAESRHLLTQILNDIHIAETNARDFEKALRSEMKDLEDAYQYFTAVKIRGLKYIITCNVKHYEKGLIPILTPEEFIKAEKKNML